MKKLLIVLLLFATGLPLAAQVRLETCSLEEVFEKAKTENKMVMVIGSTTWCGPCKRLYNDIFPLKDVGDYINSRFVVRKYDMDVDAPQRVRDMNITSYPTFVLLNNDGREVSRTSGVQMDMSMGVGSEPRGDEFIKQIEEALDPANSWEARTERFKKDPSYAKEHIVYLMSLKRFEDADLAVQESYHKRSAEENFSDEYLGIYRGILHYNGRRTLQLLLDDAEAGRKVMGAERYDAMMRDIGTDMVFANAGFPERKMLDANLEIIKANPVLRSAMYGFVIKAKDYIYTDNIEMVARTAIGMVGDFSSNERYALACYLGDNYTEGTKPYYAEYLRAAIAVETDDILKSALKSRLDEIEKTKGAGLG